MIQPKILFFFFIGCFANLTSYGQDLRKAARAYYLNEHFEFDKDVISTNKIKTLEKHQLSFSDDALNYDEIIEKHVFKIDGNPEYVLKEPLGTDKSEMYFTYDRNGNLIIKEIFGIGPDLNYERIESYEWFYTEGHLRKASRFLLIDKIETEKGGHYFPQEFFLYTNDTILYNDKDTSCLVISNNPEHCKGVSLNLYPLTFEHIINTTLKFHPNNKLASKTISREDIIQINSFDLCGNSVLGNTPNKVCLKRIGNKTQCLAPQKINICNAADTITINNTKMYFFKSQSNYFQHDSGPGTQIIKNGISYYNLDFRIISSYDTTTYIRGSMIGQNKFTENKTIRISTYEYFDSGLLKKVTTKDENGKITNVIEFKIEHF
jgi:hypothetical protein